MSYNQVTPLAVQNVYAFWTANGTKKFATMPGGLLEIAPEETPICLQNGHLAWGATHIRKEHSEWLQRINMDVPEIVWRACQKQGSIYNTEEDNKFKIRIILPLNVLLVLRYIAKKEPFFTVVTLYLHQGALDGSKLNNYPGGMTEESIPTFDLEQPPKQPKIEYKKSRSLK